MEISKDIEIIDFALWIKEERVLIINDLHLGYEESLRNKGILVPSSQIGEIKDNLEKILNKVNPRKIILNGDLKHSFGKILNEEWRDILALFDYLLGNCEEIIIIKGNHDLIIRPIAEKRGVRVLSELRIKNTLIVHGDELTKTDAKRIIIGHEHPAITIRESSKREKYKCFLKGKWKKKELIVMPSFNPLVEGSDILKEKLLSPYLTNIEIFQVFVLGKEDVFNFGKVKNLI